MDQDNNPQAAQPVVEQPATAGAPSDRSFLASFALASVAGFTGLRNLYTKRKALGIIRLALLAIALLLLGVSSLIPDDSAAGMVVAASLMVFIALAIWTVVDMCIALFGKHVDANQQPLQEVEGERKIAKTLFVGSIIAMVLPIAAVIAIPFISLATYSSDDSSSEATGETIAISLSREEATQAYLTIDSDTTRQQLETSLGLTDACQTDTCTYAIPDREASPKIGILYMTFIFINDQLASKELTDNFVESGPTIFEQIGDQYNSELDEINRQIDELNAGGIYGL